jgi:hypothetical protein
LKPLSRGLQLDQRFAGLDDPAGGERSAGNAAGGGRLDGVDGAIDFETRPFGDFVKR